MTTLIREWGTRSGLQAVLQVGGQTNFGPSAEALLTQFDDAPQLIVIADGDGDPEAGIPASVVVFGGGLLICLLSYPYVTGNATFA